MKTFIYFLFTFLIVNLFTKSLAAQMLTLPEAQKLLHQLYEDKIISKKGESEFLKALSGQEMEIEVFWKESYNPGMGFSILTEKSDLPLTTIQSFHILYLFNEIEQIHDIAEAATYENFIRLTVVKNPENIITQCESLKGAAWKKHRPQRINYESSEAAVQEAAAQFQWWVQTLDTYGLLLADIKEDALEWIEKRRFINQIMDTPNPMPDFFQFLSTRVLYDGLSNILIEHQANCIDTLRQLGAINEKNYTLLKSSLNFNKPKRNIDFLPFFDDAMVLDGKDYENLQYNYVEIYRIFIELVKDSLIPDLELNEIYQFSKDFIDNEYGGKYTDEFLSITLNGIEYHQAVGNIFPAIGSDEGNMENDIIGSMINDRYISFFQEYLTDRKSPYRMLLVSDKDKIRQKIGTRLGVLLFTNEQMEQIQQLFGFEAIGISNVESYFHYYTFEDIKALIDDFQRIGVLNNLSTTKANALIPDLRTIRNIGLRSIINNLPQVVANLHVFYPEYEEDPDSFPYPFRDLIERLSAVSRNQFMPTDVQQGWQEYREEETYPVSTGFNLNGKLYNIEVNNWEENTRFWDKGGIVDFVNQALKDQRIDGQFYSIDHIRSYSQSFIYLNSKQYEYLNKNYPELFPK